MRDDALDTCDSCEQPWAVRLWWAYTSPERYCLDHLLEPIEGRVGATQLDSLPDCRHILWRAVPDHPHAVTLHSLAVLKLALGSGVRS